MDILPAIDLRGGKVVRLIQGDYARQIDYADDPLAIARQFQTQGASWLHVVDLDGARSGRPENLPAVEAVVRGTQLAVEVGGGVRSAETAEALLDLGVRRVVVGTRALRDWAWFCELVNRPRLQRRVMLGLDARGGRLAVEGWTEATGVSVVEAARRAENLPLAGIICTDIATDGMMAGPNVAALAKLVAATSHPVIASGGVRSVADIRDLAAANAAGVIIGRALYEGRLSVAEALAAASG